MRLLDNRGDTIVEVMIVLAMPGLALSIAYSTANRSLIDTRSAQENAYATSLLSSQLESVRTLGPASTVFNGSDFCINTAVFPPISVPATNAACTVNGLYTIKGKYDLVKHNFTFTAIWDDAGGRTAKNSVTLAYRLYQ